MVTQNLRNSPADPPDLGSSTKTKIYRRYYEISLKALHLGVGNSILIGAQGLIVHETYNWVETFLFDLTTMGNGSS